MNPKPKTNVVSDCSFRMSEHGSPKLIVRMNSHAVLFTVIGLCVIPVSALAIFYGFGRALHLPDRSGAKLVLQSIFFIGGTVFFIALLAAGIKMTIHGATRIGAIISSAKCIVALSAFGSMKRKYRASLCSIRVREDLVRRRGPAEPFAVEVSVVLLNSNTQTTTWTFVLDRFEMEGDALAEASRLSAFIFNDRVVSKNPADGKNGQNEVYGH